MLPLLHFGAILCCISRSNKPSQGAGAWITWASFIWQLLFGWKPVIQVQNVAQLQDVPLQWINKRQLMHACNTDFLMGCVWTVDSSE
jgi:hypothetical protein